MGAHERRWSREAVDIVGWKVGRVLWHTMVLVPFLGSPNGLFQGKGGYEVRAETQKVCTGSANDLRGRRRELIRKQQATGSLA